MKTLTAQGIETYKRLLQATKQHWSIFLFGIIGTIMVSLTDAGLAWLIKPIINKGFIDRNKEFIRCLPLIIVCVSLLRGIAGFLSTYFINRVARNIVMDFRRAIFNHLLRLPAKFYDTHNSGHLLSTIIYNVEQVAQASSDALVTILQEASLAIGLLVVMFLVNSELTLFFLVVTPVIVWVMKICSTRLRHLSTSVQKSVGEVTHIASEGIEAYKVIRLYGGYKYENEKFYRATKSNQQRELKVIVTNSVNTSLVQLLIAIPISIILFFAIQPALHVTAGSFTSVVSAMIMMLRPVRRLTMVNSYIQKGIAGAESIFNLLDEDVEKDTGTRYLLRAKGIIEYRDVRFSYGRTKKLILQDINFRIEPGQTVALVGQSGAGKSTLINLLPRFYDVSNGEIKLDGINIKDFQLQELRSQFALVSQHTALFNDTILYNIAYGQAGRIDKRRIIEVANAAHATEFIEQLPDGLDTIVGENGIHLSGGQRQRIAIARALFKNASILILDEATSSLDTHSERHIQAALDSLMQRYTTLVIAHRLSTIEKADWIIVLKGGHLIEKGTHQQLLTLDGAYADLYRMQFSEVPIAMVGEE
ncbi:lipid A export permease/ATP-binding protein MsbA [Coxiella endosymbiont of Amblyomma nuttalli]|uniref:lipid A export permease/ATP-binding protein MsbA n=1 Tax=Coxiella endosymbiont of Amblyomma nuttalli TaxID=2749996 RepID=UPI001BA523BB|nr:lipid A export permease/ATP-binding protein MsbA [Coxiella endosymbiont of Amblyomma nuttalli]QTS84075.1 Lipid A export ATP-binding/permease protein MsbA [Coxiella endosymbiont of Amblyomma nuttalli]